MQGNEDHAHHNSETKDHLRGEFGPPFVGVEEALNPNGGGWTLRLRLGLGELDHTVGVLPQSYKSPLRTPRVWLP